MLARDFVTQMIYHLDLHRVVMPRMVAESILAHVCGVERALLDGYGQLNEDETMRANNLVYRVVQGEPFEYVIGKVEFFGNEIALSRCAHIPSPETELMLDFAIKTLKERGVEYGVVYDVCCGSGCIGLGLKKTKPELEVILTDIDLACTNLARDNAERLHLDVKVIQGDFLEPVKQLKADVLFCNPPYISEEEFQTLDASVKDYEPKHALVARDDGLYFYKKLARELPACLNPGALVFVEIGYNQGESVKQLFKASRLTVVSCEKDLAGHDRFFFLEYQ